MSWKDRLRPAAYSAPDGTRMEFQFVDVGKTLRKKTVAHEFPDVSATYVEDKGMKGSLFPLRVLFSGADYDLAATQFEGLISQQGPGTLEHPMYGTMQAIPFGDINRRDDLVTAGNQAVFEVVFWHTIAALYPSADQATLQLVDDAVANYDNTGAVQFDDSMEVATAGQESEFAANMRQLKDGADEKLQAAKDGTAKLQNKMKRINDAIESTLETFVGGPLTLAFQLRQLVGAPARAASLLRARLDAYGNLAASIVAGAGGGAGGGTGSSAAGPGVVDPGTGAPGAIVAASNSFHSNRLLAEVSILGIALAVSGETYRTRSQALASALELADQFDTVVTWSEENYTVLFGSSAGPDATQPNSSGVGSMDTGEARQALAAVVSATLAYLIATSFTLGVEKSITLASPATAIDLVSRLYGGIDRLDEFMESNDFTGDEILEIPRGRTVKYYAQ